MKKKAKICFVVAPGGQVGGGMGRVKDYILAAQLSEDSDLRFVPLVTRDQRGAKFSLLLLLSAIFRVWTDAILGRVGLVHVNFGDNGSAFRKSLIIAAAFVARVPVLLHLHAVELERQHEDGGRARRWLIAIPFRMSTSIAVLGVRWKRWLTEDLGVPPKKIDVLWNGVPVGSERRLSQTAKNQPARVLFLGNLMERKGVADLLEAMASLPKPWQWRLQMAGGGDVDRYREMARNLQIDSHVEFLGWLDQETARRAVVDARLLVLPSYEEGLPLVILESLGLGTPVVCTPVGSIPEVLTDGETALFATPGDKEGLAAAIGRLLGDSSLCQTLSVNGRALYTRLFSINAFHANLATIYQVRYALNLQFQ